MTNKNATAAQRPHTAPTSAAIRPNVVTVTPDDDRGRPTMKAVTWHGKRDVRVDTVADPRIQHRVWATAGRHFDESGWHVVDVSRVQGFHSVLRRHCAPLRDEIQPDHPASQLNADPGSELPHRPQPESGEGAAIGHGGVAHALPGRWENVRQE